LWVGGRVFDSTEIAVVSLDSEVSLFSPGRSPGVLDEPVWGSVVFSVSDEEDSVVEVLSTQSLDDSTEVELEVHGVNGDGDWSVLEGGHQLLGVLLWDVSEASDLKETLALRVGTVSVSSSVWIVSFGLNLGLLEVLEGIVHKTSLAPLVSEGSRAVNELLLGERNELSSGDEVGTLHRSGGGEGPAGSAGALVLDWGDGTRSDPVDLGWEVGDVEVDWLGLVGLEHGWLVSESLLELVVGHVSELVQAHHEVDSVLGVVVDDLVHVLSEDSESVLILGSGDVGFSPLSAVLREGELNIRWSGELLGVQSEVSEGGDGSSSG